MTRGPYQLVDTVFANPVDSRSCAMGFGGNGGVLYSIALSNASSTNGCVLNPASTHKARVYNVPLGSPEARALLPSLGPNTMFFRSDSDWTAANGGGATAVFDLVRDFGADRAGQTDAAPALAACVKAAAAKSNGAECYIPAGTYTLNATVEICGAGFSLGGTGWNSVLRPAPGLSTPLLVAGPGAGCDASDFTIHKLKTSGMVQRPQPYPTMPDFVLSRVAAVPASRKDKFGAFSLRGGGDASGRINVTLSEVSFESDSGYVFNGLIEVRKPPFRSPVYTRNDHFPQDKLGTSIEKAENQSRLYAG